MGGGGLIKDSTLITDYTGWVGVVKPAFIKQGKAYLRRNKNARHPKEEHIAQNLNGIKIPDRAGEDLKKLDQQLRI